MTIRKAAESDDRLKALKALRDRLALELDDCESKRDMASLSQRFMDVLEQIEAIGGSKRSGAKEVTGLSDFEHRLAERQKAAKAPRRATG